MGTTRLPHETDFRGVTHVVPSFIISLKSYVSPGSDAQDGKRLTSRSVPEATDRMPVALVAVVAVHADVSVTEVPVVRIAAIGLGSAPKVRGVAEIDVKADVEASRNGREARGVVARRIVADCAGGGSASPACSGGERLGDIVAASVALVPALGTHIVGELLPLRIAWHVPARRTDALHP